jgi:hypothetical protein
LISIAPYCSFSKFLNASNGMSDGRCFFPSPDLTHGAAEVATADIFDIKFDREKIKVRTYSAKRLITTVIFSPGLGRRSPR